MRNIRNIALLLAVVLTLTGCSQNDFQDDIDRLNGQYTKIDQRVGNIEKQVSDMNTQLTQLSVLATAVEKGFYITQVKTTADYYELTFSNGRVIILQNGTDNRLTPMPATSMTQIDGFFYWTLNGMLLTDENGRPIRSTGKAPIVRYDFTKLQWMVSIDGGVTFQNIDIMASVILNDEVLMQVINSYVRQHSTTIISQEVLFQIISTYIQQNYAQLFSVQLLDQVVATHIREHYTRIFSYELLEKIFSQYNFSYMTGNIRVEELCEAIIKFLQEHKEVFLNNDVLYEIISAYMEENKTDIFTDQLLLEVINNFFENNTDFIDIDLLTLVVSNYIDTHQDELFNSETVGKLIMDYVAKYYTQIFSQDILVRLVNTYVKENRSTIFNETLIKEILNDYVKNNSTTIIKKDTITELINNYLKKNTTSVFNREVLEDVIAAYFEKNYNLFIDKTVITKAVNDYITKHQTTIISREVISEVVNSYIEHYYTEVFTREMMTQVVSNYFEKHTDVITQHISQGMPIIRNYSIEQDHCTFYLAGGSTIELAVYDDMARLRDRVQSIVQLPVGDGNTGTDVLHTTLSLRYLITPSNMVDIIADAFHCNAITMELKTTDGKGHVQTVPVSSCFVDGDVLCVEGKSATSVAAVALHISENKVGGTDITSEFTVVEYKGEQQFDERITQDIPEEYLKLISPYMPIYSGNTPPTFVGTWIVSKYVSVYDYTNNYEPGHGFADMIVEYSAQNKTKNTVTFRREQIAYSNSTPSYISYTEKTEAKVLGSGSNFTTYVIATEKKADGSWAKQAYIYSGTVSEKGIKNFFSAFVLLDKYDPNNSIVPIGACRIFKDEDGTSEATKWVTRKSSARSKARGAVPEDMNETDPTTNGQ